ncbi:MAG TPA: T9SS type A sorting domain-containing protein [Aquaticitalea sp.]|nr:T9SS type A sorting domain-containing protein [Aquaticitalea sp.]
MKKILLAILTGLLFHFGNTQCNVETAIDENFDNWTAIDECWNKITEGALVYPEEGSIVFYSLFSPNTNTMLVTPEIASGTYTLMFDPGIIGSDSAAIQIGTLTDNANAATFTAVGSAFDLNADTATYSLEVTVGEGEYLAFSATIPFPHVAIGLDNVVLGHCLPVSSINESFEDWTAIDECWNKITEGALVYAEGGSVVFYSLFSPNTNTMLVTPEIVPGNYTFQFDANVIESGSATMQVGKMTNNTDASTFTAVGSAFGLTTDATSYSVEVTINEGEYLAFSANIPLPHIACTVDNIELNNALSAPDFVQDTFEIKIYPNPSNGIVNIALNEFHSTQNSVAIYNMTGAKIFETTFLGNSVNGNALNLSHLQTGTYLLRLTSGDVTVTKKLIMN